MVGRINEIEWVFRDAQARGWNKPKLTRERNSLWKPGKHTRTKTLSVVSRQPNSHATVGHQD